MYTTLKKTTNERQRIKIVHACNQKKLNGWASWRAKKGLNVAFKIPRGSARPTEQLRMNLNNEDDETKRRQNEQEELGGREEEERRPRITLVQGS